MKKTKHSEEKIIGAETIPPNGSRIWLPPGVQLTGGGPIGRVRVDRVVLEDGEFAGPDTTNLYEVLSTAMSIHRREAK